MSQSSGSDVRARVIDACEALYVAGQQDMVWGHVAIRDPAGRGVWMKRSGLGFEELRPDDIHLVGWDGSVVEGAGKAHIECWIHLEIMRARPDVGSTAHTHPPAVNAFSALEVPLLALSHEGVLFADPQVPRSPLSGDLIGNSERGSKLAVALGKASACLMPRHGLVAVGGDEGTAVMHAVLLEGACEVYLMAASAGDIVSFSDGSELADKRAHAWPPSQLEAGYDYLVRVARRRRLDSPDR